MIVVYKQSQSLEEAQAFFGINNPAELPFVDSTLGEVSISGWRALGTTKFYIPQNWTHLNDGSGSFVVYDDITTLNLGKELTVFTDLSVLPIFIPHPEDLGPREVTRDGPLSFGHGFNTMRDFLLCKDMKTGGANYIEYTLSDLADTILSTIPDNEKAFIENSFITSGVANIDEESEIIGDSRVYGPCLIVNSVITNSVVYPGSIIINSRIANSTIESSYIQNSGISGSTLRDAVAYTAHLDALKAKDSQFPKGTRVNGK